VPLCIPDGAVAQLDARCARAPLRGPAAPVLRSLPSWLPLGAVQAPSAASSRGGARLPAAQAVGHGFAWQPLPNFWQHHAFFGIDQPACQFAQPALQS